MYDDDAAARMGFGQKPELHAASDFWAACGRDGLNMARDGRGSCRPRKGPGRHRGRGIARLHDQGLGDEDDIRFLAPLKHILTDGRTRADRILAGEVPF